MPIAPSRNKGNMVTSPRRNAASEAILTVALEGLAVAVFTLLAGAGPQMGNIMMIFMVGFWLMYMVTNAGLLERLNIALKIA